MNINLITGGTGFLGQNLITKLLKDGEKIWIITRGESDAGVKEKVKKAFPNDFKKIVIFNGDVLKKNIGLSENDILKIKNKRITLWHLAANLSFASKDKKIVYETNFIGAKNIVEFANKIKIEKINYVSTAYVSGEYNGLILEDKLIENPKFRNMYEESKYKAEKFLRENFNGQYLIFRPSIILGEIYTGKATGCTFGYYRFSYMFFLFKLWVIEKMNGENGIWKIILKIIRTKYDIDNDKIFLPWLYFMYVKKSVVNLIPVDFVVNSMIIINKENNNKNETIHLTNKKPANSMFLIKNIFKSLGYEKTKHIVVPRWIYFGFIKIFYFLTYPIKNYTKSIYWYLPYFTEDYNFDYKNSEKYNLDFKNVEIDKKYIAIVNKYAKDEIFNKIDNPKL